MWPEGDQKKIIVLKQRFLSGLDKEGEERNVDVVERVYNKQSVG